MSETKWCYKCKALVDVELKHIRELHTELYEFGHTPTEEIVIEVCPCCGKDTIEEAGECEICGALTNPTSEYCEDCLGTLHSGIEDLAEFVKSSGDNFTYLESLQIIREVVGEMISALDI